MKDRGWTGLKRKGNRNSNPTLTYSHAFKKLAALYSFLFLNTLSSQPTVKRDSQSCECDMASTFEYTTPSIKHQVRPNMSAFQLQLKCRASSKLSMERYHEISNITMDNLLGSFESLIDSLGDTHHEVEYSVCVSISLTVFSECFSIERSAYR